MNLAIRVRFYPFQTIFERIIFDRIKTELTLTTGTNQQMQSSIVIYFKSSKVELFLCLTSQSQGNSKLCP